MKKTERQAVDEFVALVGGKSWKRISRACRGDFIFYLSINQNL